MTTQLRRLRRARTRAIPGYFVVARASELDDVRLTLETLPICAHGRVIVLADRDEAVAPLQLPPRICVTVIRAPRDVESAVAVGRAVEAWADEMLCDEFDLPPLQVWFAGDASQWVETVGRLTSGYGLPAEMIKVGSGLGKA